MWSIICCLSELILFFEGMFFTYSVLNSNLFSSRVSSLRSHIIFCWVTWRLLLALARRTTINKSKKALPLMYPIYKKRKRYSPSMKNIIVNLFFYLIVFISLSYSIDPRICYSAILKKDSMDTRYETKQTFSKRSEFWVFLASLVFSVQ